MKKMSLVSLLFCLTAFGQQKPEFVPPAFPNGGLSGWILKNVTFPPQALQDSLTERVMVNFELDDKGNFIEFELSGWVPCFLHQAQRSLKRLSLTPATQDGIPVATSGQFILDFGLLLDSVTRSRMTYVGLYSEPIFQCTPKDTLDFNSWLCEKFKMPSPLTQGEGKIGSARVSFVLDRGGNITRPQVECDQPQIADELRRLLELCPQWIKPAEVNGAPHIYTYDRTFGYQTGKTKYKNMPFFFSERLPWFQRGDLNQLKYGIYQQIRYPTYCAEYGIQGDVLVAFVIEKDGTLGNIETLLSPHKQLTEEVIRVLRTIPNWEPGLRGASPVRVRYTFPFSFRIDDGVRTNRGSGIKPSVTFLDD